MPDTSRVEPTPPAAPHAQHGPAHTKITALHVVRFLVELFAIFTFAWWGFTAWPFAWNVLVGVGAPAVAIVVWALFVSPKAVIRVHPFIRAGVELLVFAAATVAWWDLGQVWIGLAFALVAVVSGVFVGRERLS
ncbi:MAG: YrdB family protein [Microbacterium sp.]|uniref:YrdB family protein n=1 Tax=Microbacterium sp. TaxID=51671 RepID=UPI003A8BE245